MERTYSDAVAALNTLQTNFAVIDAFRKSGGNANAQAIPETIEWCRRIGYEPSDFDRIKPIHIAGTKGKGSTSAFISSILTQYLPSPSQPKPLFHKIGLYTSPHLRFVRERIQINNQPLSEEIFARYFFEVWDRLEDSARSAGLPTDTSAKPAYFRFLTLMAFHTYISEDVDTAVIECGIGGEYDTTNILVSPTVTGITNLGIDHTSMLGNTIEEIAWHKAGIFKPSAPAYTVQQLPQAMPILHQRALEKSTSLRVASPSPEFSTIKLGLAASFQYINASLATEIVAAHLSILGHSTSTSPLPPEFIRGLQQVHWPGRCDIRRESNIVWHLDGGHTLESIKVAAKWFAEQIPRPEDSINNSSIKNNLPPTRPRVLVFNQQTRDAGALAQALHTTLVQALGAQRPFTHAVFCTNVTFKNGGYKPDLVSLNTNSAAVGELSVQRGLARTWEDIDAGTEVKVLGTIEEAVGWVREVAAEEKEEGEVMVLCTGSVHLIGGMLEVLETGGKGEG
ncbi:Folylpolyglutamate synthetase [Toensbergia leucococca]|nr:Folylpolyglutamate synthetase [Toensbergia leucococca]